MLITKRSQLTGKMNTMDIPVTQEKLDEWNNGRHPAKIQDFFRELDDQQREFLMTGSTSAEWTEVFGEEE